MSLSPTLHVRVETDYPVSMRDGTILRGTLFRPDTPGTYPALLHRSPYGTLHGGFERYVRAGYVVYAQDARGRYTSDGTHRLFSLPDDGEGQDGYDTIQHLAEQPWCNGIVGQFGASYPGYLTWTAAALQPPALKATFAETIPRELATLDYPYGCFRPARRIYWWLNNIAPDWRRRLDLPEPHTGAQAKTIWNEQTHSQWLALLPWSKIIDHLPGQMARDVAAWLDNPGAPYWNFPETVYPHLQVPNCDDSGWYDHCNDSIYHLPQVQQHAATELARTQSKVIIGPWSHVTRGASQLGDVDYGLNAAVDLIDTRIRWFDRWLKNIPNGVDDWPAVQYFQMGTATWKSADTWPPPSTPRPLYLASTGNAHDPASPGTLVDLPLAENPPDSYHADPHDPLPTLWTPALFTMVSDRRQLDHRRDLLRYHSQPLTQPVSIAGDPQLILHAASTAPDTDFHAWLIDEAPDGTALHICHGMVRARHRHTLTEPTVLIPGEIVEYTITLSPTANTFLPGHRIRLDIASADYPNYDRNHHTGGDDLRETAMQPADQTILHSQSHPTRIILPITS